MVAALLGVRMELPPPPLALQLFHQRLRAACHVAIDVDRCAPLSSGTGYFSVGGVSVRAEPYSVTETSLNLVK